MKTCIRTLALVTLTTFGFAANTPAQQAFPSPDEAAKSLVDALGTDHADQARLAQLLGKDWHQYIPEGSVDRADVDAFLKMYAQQHAVEKQSDGRELLAVGSDHWTLPIPLVKNGSGWHFDPAAGADLIRARRIGRNELAAIESVRAYYDAQMDYAEADHDDDGVLEYAQHLLSSDGSHDGLYWPEDDSGEISPLGPLFGDATPGGDWHGYHFRILEAQGPSAPGGAYDYRLGDNMTRGFALVAWPASYGDTGVMSFMISHAGDVFQKDMGPDTARLAAAMKTFDPDSSWTAVPAAEGEGAAAAGDDAAAPGTAH